ncbi:MAG: DUF87 domain-containing protein [Minisyncoccia bacterium]
MQYEGPKQPLSSHEEELAHLRAQVEAKERELDRMKQSRPREEVVRERLRHHLTTPVEHVTTPEFRATPAEVHEIALNLEPESDDATMNELRRVMEEKGVHSAFEVLARLKSPHLEDDFHRFLVAYVIAGMGIKGLQEGQPEWKSLHMTLYEISLPEPETDPDQDERYKHFKEHVSAMEQVYNGMMAVEEAYQGEPPYFTFELAVPVDKPHLRFYASVPNSKSHLFEKQVLAVFPKAVVAVQPNDYNSFAHDGTAVASTAVLQKQHALPLKDYGDYDYDPLNALLNAFDKLQGDGEGASVQFVVRPVKHDYGYLYRRILKYLRQGEHRSRALEVTDNLALEMFREIRWMFRPKKEERESFVDDVAVKAVEKKIQGRVVETNIRIVASSPDVAHANRLLTEIEASFNLFENPEGNRLSFKRHTGGSLRTILKAFTYRLFKHEGMLPLSLKEVTAMYHYPYKGVKGSPHLAQSRFTGAAAPVDLPEEGLLLGTNTFRGKTIDVRLSPPDRMRHLYVIGQTGTGKTSFMKTLIEQDIKAGNGVCFIDPHGNDILDVLASVPPERYEDVIYFDPAELSRPFGLNLLEYDPRFPEQKTFIVNELLAIFKRLYGDVPESMGPAFEQYFRNSTMLVMEDPASGSTMLDIARVLSNAGFRNKKLARSNNPVVNQFWTEIATRAEGEASLANIVPYITNKFDDFTANDFMRPIVGQQESSFKFREIMDQKKILLVNLSKGRLGERNANLLGLIIVGKLFMAALSRADSPGKDFPPFYLYIDEFQNITTDSIPGILSEARKYKLALTIAHQFLKQVDEKIRDAVFGNVGSMTVFRVGEEDGEFFAKQFAPVFKALDFVNIENYNAYVRILAAGVPQKPFNVKTLSPVVGNQDQIDDLRELSYLTYGRDRETVEAEIRSRYLSF